MESLAQQISIDRSSPVPLYFQFAQQLQNLIETGVLPPGTRLSNEVAMADQFGLSRPTMRQAMQHLVDKGLLARKRGVGTQVVTNRIRRQLEFTSLYEDLERDRRHPTTEVLSIETKSADSGIAAALRVAEGSDVVAIQRLRFADDEPIAIMHNHLPADLVELTRAALCGAGLYQLLRRSGMALSTAEQTIGARRATAAEAKLLDETRGAPLLTMVRTAHDGSGRPVEYGSHVYRASRYSFAMTVAAH
ncbi:DNA-binding transcriptional regulator, GntR family [Streptomyces sp. DvalAA-14]|uniref:GntR family transcriptional regulator n=1 Tax=unclassified Streptomyces TaxID=2593676 RepID=UPI00081B87EF|nr:MULTISPECIES: GntR family transcriptional regulator [unclassified Streptomyces]MYS22422.1 UTRA domain-containing protein [Streptomyces sp. SID4948]SCE15982.1 DNA-binding transcriptional regulator, GntR family [Streptomyces sp. DvalAA-14]